MLWSDSERRKTDIKKTAELFKERGYTTTANEILNFVSILEEKIIPLDFLDRLASVFGVYEKEFVEELSIGKNYRQRCLWEIVTTVLEALKRTPSNFSQSLNVIHPLLTRLSHGREITETILDEINTVKSIYIRLHVLCYCYLVIVEGIFDECARMLYFLKIVSDNNIPTLKDVENMSVWKVLRKFKGRPVFLEKWEEKKHVRNAIGHAQVYYNEIEQEVRFIDKKWDKTFSTEEFIEKALELEYTVNAFLDIFLLLRIHVLIRSPKPFST